MSIQSENGVVKYAQSAINRVARGERLVCRLSSIPGVKPKFERFAAAGAETPVGKTAAELGGIVIAQKG